MPAAVVGVIIPPCWAAFAERYFVGVDFFTGIEKCSFVIGAFGCGDSAAGGPQVADQTLAGFFVQRWIGTSPQAFLVNEVAPVGGGGVFHDVAFCMLIAAAV
jgi:hypothetical protein